MIGCGHRDWTRARQGMAWCDDPAIDRWVSVRHCDGCTRWIAPPAPTSSQAAGLRGLGRRFGRRPRIRIDDPEAGILTAADAAAFPGLQFLLYSLILSHEVRITVIDLGLTAAQRAWCGRRPIDVLDLAEIGGIHPMGSQEFMWQTWNKPSYFLHTPYRKTLWLDADTVVLGDLRELFGHLDQGPMLLGDPEIQTPALAWNSDALYDILPVPRRITQGLPNAGVLGLVRGRDDDLLRTWRTAVEIAALSPVVRRSMAWWDQGALAWAVERLQPRRVPRLDWNTMVQTLAPDPAGLLKWLETETAPLIHFAGTGKPWCGWTEEVPIDLEAAVAQKLTVFVLGHSPESLAAIPDRPFFRPINLRELPLGEFQSEQLSESRIYLTDLLDRCETEYLGLATASWDRKYQGPTYPDRIRLADLELLGPELSPDVIWAADPSSPVWALESAQYHPGMGPILLELAYFTGLHLTGPSFWSNNFICHRSVMKEFLVYWRWVFEYLYKKYGFHPPYSTEHYFPDRHFGYLLERVTMLWFANRPDLEIKPLTYLKLWSENMRENVG